MYGKILRETNRTSHCVQSPKFLNTEGAIIQSGGVAHRSHILDMLAFTPCRPGASPASVYRSVALTTLEYGQQHMHDFHPLTAAWFARRFGSATEPQSRAWPEIRAGRDVLISAPTGSGKTLAAFLICLDRLVARGLDTGTLDDRTEVVYVSPLRALSTDINRNLESPLAGLAALAGERGLSLPTIRTAVRTGDTPVWEREQMRRQPPHLLVTTPESLFILLTAERSRRTLRHVRTIIIDEIHAFVDDKRGSHLALSLARLDDLVGKAGGSPVQRIGLSATVHPIADVAAFLKGVRPATDDRPSTGAIRIVDAGHRRQLHLAIDVPQEELGVLATNEMWGEIYDRMSELVRAHRTTLIFVNTRRLCERVAHHLEQRLGEGIVLAHHGSLSRRLRHTAETELKAGTLRAVVATASLELGIDIGTIDLVCQVGSPRSLGVALQRVGRSGHTVDRSRVPKGRFFPTTRDELLECGAIVRGIRRGRLDTLEMPKWPRDILAQQLVAAAACEDWNEDALFSMVRSAYPYRNIPRAEFDALVTMLSEGITTQRGRYGAYLHWDRVNRVIRGRRGARLAAITSGGAIPDNANYLVVAEPEGTTVGTVDEDFAVESMSGDIFLLGTSSWKIRRVESGRVRVEDAHGAVPTIPFWRGEAPGRTHELSDEVSELRMRISELSTPGDGLDADRAAIPSAAAFLTSECGMNQSGAEQAVAYVRAGRAALGAVPSTRTVVAERFFDEGGGMQLVLHAPFGTRINRAWGLALRKRFCRSFNFELQAAATDNGIVISLAEQHSFPLEVIFRFLAPDSVQDVLTQAMLPAPMFAARWRWNAARALAVIRFAGGRKVAPPLQRMRSDDLLASVFPDQVACQENLVGEIRTPDHPLVNETIRDCLHEAMDLDGLRDLLRALDSGAVDWRAVDTAEPSPFSHEILNANPYAFLDDAPLEERRARAIQLRRTLPSDASEVGSLDEVATAEVERDSVPLIRNADELHDALLTLCVMPPAEQYETWFQTLREAHRATTVVVSGPGDGPRRLWVATERVCLASKAYPESRLTGQVPEVDQPTPATQEDATVELLRGWLEATGPQTASERADRLALSSAMVEAAFARLEGEGQLLRGQFSAAGRVVGAETEWCNRRVLARIHHLTLGRLRREVEPVSAADFVRFLARWQHVAPTTQLHGTSGLLQVIKQLQGYETSSAAWESDVLARRVAKYEREMLDGLCMSGDVMWGRISPHPAFGAGQDNEQRNHKDNRSRRATRGVRRVRPTRVAPVTILLREDADWLIPTRRGDHSPEALSHPAREVLEQLRGKGASFLRELVRTTGRLPSEVEDGLWELVAAGLVTADGFDSLRALIDPKRRRGEGRHRAARPRHTAGRWALLRPVAESETPSGLDPNAGPAVESFARQLLARWGVVFRDLIVRETTAPGWRDLLSVLRRMEARGEIRGGRFVDGFLGEQFALPEALEALRLTRRTLTQESPHTSLSVSAADPLNLVGIVIPGERVSVLSGQRVEVLGGRRQESGVRSRESGGNTTLAGF